MARTILRRSELQRAFYIRHITGMTITPQTPLDQLRRIYYAQFLGGSPTNRGLDDMEQDFLRRWIVNQGGVPLQTNFNSPLWKQAVVQLGVIPSKWQATNEILFYQNAP